MTLGYEYLSGLTLPQILRVVGFFFYIGSFAAVQIGALSGNSIKYALANVAAASLVLISLTAEFNLASALIQISFITIGLVGVARQVLLKPSRLPAQP